MNDYWHIRHIDWLDDLTPAESEALKRDSSAREYAPGETIFAPTPQPTSVYVVEDGLARIYRLSESGAETTFGYVTPGEVFGELTLFGEAGRESFADAVTRSTIRKVPRSVFERLLAARPSLVLAVTKQIGARLRRIESRVENLVFRGVRSRVARVLLDLGHDFGRREDLGIVITIPLTQGELATLVGSVRQTVNETLREFEQSGWIGRDGRRLVLRKPEELQRAGQSEIL